MCNIDVHIKLFSIYTKMSKTRALAKSVLSVATYGIFALALRLSLNAVHKHGLVAM